MTTLKLTALGATLVIAGMAPGCSKSPTNTSSTNDSTANDPADKLNSAAAPAADPETQTVTIPAGLIPAEAGRIIHDASTKGSKGTLINVWATWCGACKAELPMLLKLREEWKPQGVDITFASVDKLQDAPKALAYLKEQGAPLPSYIVYQDLEEFKPMMSPLWKGSLPATFLFDSSGKLRYYWGAQVFENEIRPIVEGFIAGEHIDGAANFSIRRGAAAP